VPWPAIGHQCPMGSIWPARPLRAPIASRRRIACKSEQSALFGWYLPRPLIAILVQAIHAAAAGDALIAPNVTARLLAAFSGPRPGPPPTSPNEPLTPREEDVLARVARGLTNTEIADELFISLSTTKTHLANLMIKLSARNRVELAMWAYETDRVNR
jgi:DNA-binding NarL/FixJ family response regulator